MNTDVIRVFLILKSMYLAIIYFRFIPLSRALPLRLSAIELLTIPRNLCMYLRISLITLINKNRVLTF